MTVSEFKTLAREMRAVQKEYFKTKSADALKRAKVLEEKFDAAIGLTITRDTQPQADLFGGATGSSKPGHAQ